MLEDFRANVLKYIYPKFCYSEFDLLNDYCYLTFQRATDLLYREKFEGTIKHPVTQLNSLFISLTPYP